MGSTNVYGHVVVGLAYLYMLQSEMADAVRLARAVRQTAIRLDDSVLAAVAASVLGAALAYLGETDEVESIARESVDRARDAGLPWIEMLGLGTLGALAMSRDNLCGADEYIQEGLRIARNSLDPWTRGIA